MKKIMYLFFFLSLSVYSPSSAPPLLTQPDLGPGPWKPIGPEGGEIEGMALNPLNNTEIYIVTWSNPAQVFQTSDSGNTWKRLALIEGLAGDVAVNPSKPNIICVLTRSGLFKSTNRGSTWKKHKFPENCYSNGKIAISRANPNIIYFSGNHVNPETGNSCWAVFKSKDGGENWTFTKIVPDSSYGDGFSIVADPKNANSVYCCGCRMGRGLPQLEWRSDLDATNKILYFGSWGGSIFKKKQ